MPEYTRNRRFCLVTGASCAFEAMAGIHVFLTAEDIARATGVSLRSAQERVARLRAGGARCSRLRRAGRGQPPWAVHAEDYAARLGIPVGELVGA